MVNDHWSCHFFPSRINFCTAIIIFHNKQFVPEKIHRKKQSEMTCRFQSLKQQGFDKSSVIIGKVETEMTREAFAQEDESTIFFK